MQGKNVLIIDADPQANATSGYGIDPRTMQSSIYECLVDEYPVDGAQVSTCVDGLELVGSRIDLAGAELELIEKPEREKVLRRLLHDVAGKYDFILIDCSPSLGLITVNALTAADSVIIPVQAEYFALEGLSDLMHTVRMVRRSLNPGLELEGVLLTMFDGRTNLALQVAEEVKRYFPGKVYSTVIPRNVRLSEAPSHGKPINYYDRTSRGAEAYSDLANEFLKQNR